MNINVNVNVGRWSARLNAHIGAILSNGTPVSAIYMDKNDGRGVYSAQMVKGRIEFKLTSYGEELFDNDAQRFDEADLDELKTYLYGQLESLAKYQGGVVAPLIRGNVQVNEDHTVHVVNSAGEFVRLGRIRPFKGPGLYNGQLLVQYDPEFVTTTGLRAETLKSLAEALEEMNEWAKCGLI